MGTAAKNSEVADVQQTRKVKNNKNGQKKAKGSLRRRISHIFTSPVHLFRRYVLRKRPKKCPKSENDSALGIEAVEATKQRNVPCYFLFLGLQQSGKSTTISKLFNGKRPSSNDSLLDPSIKVYKNTSAGENIGLTVVDTPGLCGNTQKDCELVTALSSFLKRDLPHRIPTVTFIVARMDDDYIGYGNTQSPFSQMLTALSHAEKHITDQLHSNLVLLLTHSQKANDIPGQISKYQKEFANVFPLKTPIDVISIDNIKYSSKSSKNEDKSPESSYHNTIFQGLKDFAGKRQEQCLNALMNWLTEETKRFSISFQQEIVPVTECLSNLSETESEKDAVLPQTCEPYLVMYDQQQMDTIKSKKMSKREDSLKSQQQQQRQVVTCIPSGSQMMLADKSLVNITKCLVGDKLFGLYNTCTVITGIRKVNLDEIFLEGKSVGNIYCSAIPNGTKDDNGDDEKILANKFIYMYNNEQFELVNASKANVPEKTCTDNLYILEVDSPNGTFVINGFPCFAQVSVPNQ